MQILEDAKRAVGRLTGLGRPSRGELSGRVRKRKARCFAFHDDGRTPNHPRWPLVIYRGAVNLEHAFDPAAVFEELFAANGWKDSWRNGVYKHLHFHTRTHEVLGIARGQVRVQFGGAHGKSIDLVAGDVAILPAGTGHCRRSPSRNLLVVGAYPFNGGAYDEPRPEEIDPAAARAAIARVSRPRKDPVYGKDGPLFQVWKAK
jgi:uncharacterized protein YjlB